MNAEFRGKLSDIFRDTGLITRKFQDTQNSVDVMLSPSFLTPGDIFSTTFRSLSVDQKYRPVVNNIISGDIKSSYNIFADVLGEYDVNLVLDEGNSFTATNDIIFDGVRGSLDNLPKLFFDDDIVGIDFDDGFRTMFQASLNTGLSTLNTFATDFDTRSFSTTLTASSNFVPGIILSCTKYKRNSVSSFVKLTPLFSSSNLSIIPIITLY